MAPAAAHRGCWRWRGRAGKGGARQTPAGACRKIGLGWPTGQGRGNERRPQRVHRPRHHPVAALKRTQRVGGKTRRGGSRPRWGWQRGSRRGHSWRGYHATPAAAVSQRKNPRDRVTRRWPERAKRTNNTASTPDTLVRTGRLRRPSLRRGPLATRSVARPWTPACPTKKEDIRARTRQGPRTALPPPIHHPPFSYLNTEQKRLWSHQARTRNSRSGRTGKRAPPTGPTTGVLAVAGDRVPTAAHSPLPRRPLPTRRGGGRWAAGGDGGRPSFARPQRQR